MVHYTNSGSKKKNLWCSHVLAKFVSLGVRMRVAFGPTLNVHNVWNWHSNNFSVSSARARAVWQAVLGARWVRQREREEREEACVILFDSVCIRHIIYCCTIHLFIFTFPGIWFFFFFWCNIECICQYMPVHYRKPVYLSRAFFKTGTKTKTLLNFLKVTPFLLIHLSWLTQQLSQS